MDYKHWRSVFGSTGPSSAFDGLYYIYTETSGVLVVILLADLTVDCVDLSTWTNPTLFLATICMVTTMGTVNVDVSTDGGALHGQMNGHFQETREMFGIKRLFLYLVTQDKFR